MAMQGIRLFDAFPVAVPDIKDIRLIIRKLVTITSPFNVF